MSVYQRGGSIVHDWNISKHKLTETHLRPFREVGPVKRVTEDQPKRVVRRDRLLVFYSLLSTLVEVRVETTGPRLILSPF